jgi:hypothetical protein
VLLVLRDGRRNVHTVDSGAVEDAYEESYFDIVMITSQDPSLSVSATIHSKTIVERCPEDALNPT